MHRSQNLILAGFLAFFVSPLTFQACGGTAISVDETSPNSQGGQGGTSGSSTTLDGGKPNPKDSGKPKPDGSKGGSGGQSSDASVEDVLPDYVDPGCPDAGPPETNYECDPNAQNTGCGLGEACYPFVTYPTTPCGQEVYGAYCISPGTGAQGDPCDAGCKDKHVCVISGQGTQCIELCDLSDPFACSNGLVCVPVDIPGIGGCI
jgi:hypothetical protein